MRPGEPTIRIKHASVALRAERDVFDSLSQRRFRFRVALFFRIAFHVNSFTNRLAASR